MTFRNSILAAALLAPALAWMPAAKAQPSLIVDSSKLDAVVESVDPATRTALLRDSKGKLITVQGGRGSHNFPQVKAGDEVEIFHAKLVSALIAKPGAPLPESSVTGASNPDASMPNGLVVQRRRERVKIDAVDTAANRVTFTGEDGAQRQANIRLRAMRDFIKTLKPGDEVDVTFTDTVTVVLKAKATP